MDNQNNSLRPEEAPEFVLDKDEMVPAEYVVSDDGSVVSVPAGGIRRMTGRSGVDGEGREKVILFLRRMGSVGTALLLDLLLGTVIAVQVMAAVFIVWMVSGTITASEIMPMMLGAMSGEGKYVDMFTYIVMLSNGVAMPIAHILAGYFHSVRGGFSVMSTMKRGSRIGWTLPASIVVALGATYAWSFAFMFLGWLMPESVFAQRELAGSSFEGASVATMVVTALYTCIGAPLTEEFLFRGVMLKSLSKYGVPFAVMLSSLLFGLIHGNIFQTPFAIVDGVILAYLAVRSGSIWPSVIVHFCVNTFSTAKDILTVVLPEEWSMTVEYAFLGAAGLMVVGAIIILCTCGKRISWHPVCPEKNNILLPEVNTRAKCKPLLMLLDPVLLIVILLYTVMIILTSGII